MHGAETVIAGFSAEFVAGMAGDEARSRRTVLEAKEPKGWVQAYVHAGGKLAVLLDLHVAPTQAYALVGMAAFVAGATHAPVSMVLMIFEMSGNYTIVLPLLIATSIASILSKRLYPESVDTDSRNLLASL